MFDYIVVGAGSAGCALASRLSENANISVLLMEAGPKDSNPMIHMPGGCAEVLKSKTLNWQLWSTPQKELNNRKVYIPRGRTLGGSSSANGMVYIRGHASDYDDWAADGNEGWSYKEVLPYFKRGEDFAQGPNAYHGSGGPLYVQQTFTENPLYDYFAAAGAEIGIPRNDDFNGEEQEGIGRFHCTIKDGKRWSSASAYLTPAVRKRTNLTIMTGANVDRLILEGNKVTGVEYTQAGNKKSVSTNKEIILCSGTVKNPQIMQLSGIGNSKDLADVGIETKVDLPGVGYNLQEHLDLIMCWECTQPITLNSNSSLLQQMKVGLQYILFKKGVAAGNGIESGGFVKSSPELSRPDIQLHFVPANMESLIDPLPKEHGMTLHACNLRPFSKGSVKLASSLPTAAPLIDFNFLSDERDWVVMENCFKILRKLMSADAWQGTVGEEIVPGKNIQSPEEIRDAIRENSETVYHPVGTCKMGNGDDAVVNHELKVYKVEGLRVADASIIPNLIGGNTNAPAMMIGEKCADMILGKTL